MMNWKETKCGKCKIQRRKPICNSCSNHNRFVPMTNADRIRAMSDEELAEWIHNITQYYDEEQEPTVSIYNLYTKKDTELHDSYGDLLNWLQSEVEE